MQMGIWFVFVSLAFSCALTGFVFAARQKGWPVGELFSKGTVTTYLSLACIASAIGYLVASVMQGGSSWWVFPAGVAAYFLGGSIAMAVFGRYSGMMAILVAPASVMVAFFV